MKQRYTTIVLGATYYGLGYASSHEGCLILEEAQTLGGDFHHCLRPVRMEEAGEAERNSEMGRIMAEYGVWTDTSFDLLKAQAVVHEYAARKIAAGMEILLDARLLSVDRNAAGVTVNFITNQGIQSVSADNLVDATVDCISAPGKVVCTAKSFNVFTVAMGEDFSKKLKTVCPACCVRNGPLENEKLIQFCVDPEATLTEAYEKMMAYWAMAFPNGEEKILFAADTFDVRYEPAGEMPAGWVAERFPNPVTAFVKGAMAQ